MIIQMREKDEQLLAHQILQTKSTHSVSVGVETMSDGCDLDRCVCSHLLPIFIAKENDEHVCHDVNFH